MALIPGTARRRTPAPPLPSALPTFRTWSVNRWRAGPSRSRRRGATRCSSWGRQGAERRCSPNACPESSRTSRRRRPSTRRASTERPGNRPGPALSSAGRSGRLTRRSPRPVCWGRKPAPAGRDLLRSLRCAFPRRILRIPRRGPGGAPAAGRIGRDPDLAIRPPVPVPVPVPAAGGDQPVPVRQRGPPPEGLPVLPAAPRPVLEKVFGAPPRPDRPRGLRASGRGRGVVRRGARRIVGGGPAPGRRLPGGSGGAVRGARFPDERDRPLRDGGTVTGAHAGSGRVPHAGGGTALPVG